MFGFPKSWLALIWWFWKTGKNYRCASVFQRKIVYFDFENMRVMHSKLRGYYFDRVTGNLRILQTWNSITLKLVILVWDVQIVILFRFGFSSVFEKKNLDSVRNELGSVQFEKTPFGLDIVVIYYLSNNWVVNLQQILQCYCAVLNELCIPYAKLGFSRVFKCSLSAHWMQVKLFLSLFSENHLYGCQIFGRFGFGSDFFYIRIRTEFLILVKDE